MRRWFLTAKGSLRNAVRLIYSGGRGEEVFTPSLEHAGVNGLMRQFCLEQLARSDFRVVEVSAGEAALQAADEVIICNALMPVVPVRAYGQQRWSSRELFQFLAPICEQTR